MAFLGLLLAVVADSALRLLVPGLRGAMPSLPLLTALFVGFHARRTEHLWLAIVLGLLQDCLSTVPAGHFAFLYGAAAYVAFRVRRFLPPDPGLAYVAASLLCGLLTSFLALVIAVISTRGSASGFGAAVLVSVTSAMSAPFAFGLLRRSRLFRAALSGRDHYEFAP
jgi:rod shape-determining protein MreD